MGKNSSYKTLISVSCILSMGYFIMRSYTSSRLVLVHKEQFMHRKVIEEQSTVKTQYFFFFFFCVYILMIYMKYVLKFAFNFVDIMKCYKDCIWKRYMYWAYFQCIAKKPGANCTLRQINWLIAQRL